MYADYKVQVILDYQKKKAAGILSINLESPSPGRLREECMMVYEERHSPKDDAVLRAFFGAKSKEDDYYQIIKKFDIDKFRPLVNLLNKRINNPDEKHIKLLSWLTGFEQTIEMQEVNEPDNTSRKNQEPGGDGKPGVDIKKPWKAVPIEKARKFIFPLIIIVLTSVGISMFLENKNQCMYWTGDHYQPVSCNAKTGNKALIALDTQKAAHFKMILRPDTITTNSVGKIWYIKIDNKIEFYNSEGFHPVYYDKRLKPITDYIINKYIKPE